MHWVLDVNFREDDSRARERTMANNLSWLRRFAVTLLKRHPDKDSLRGKLISCVPDTDYLCASPVITVSSMQILAVVTAIASGPARSRPASAAWPPPRRISSRALPNFCMTWNRSSTWTAWPSRSAITLR